MRAFSALELLQTKLPLKRLIQPPNLGSMDTLPVCVLRLHRPDAPPLLGEAMPLAGLHKESMEQVVAEIRALAPALKALLAQDLKTAELLQPLLGLIKRPLTPLSGSTLWAVESALLGSIIEQPDMWSFRSTQLILDDQQCPDPLCGDFKIKVDGRKQDQLDQWTDFMVQHPKWRFRLDANQSFTAESFRPWAAKWFRLPQVRYVEEPFALASRAHGRESWRLGLDESLYQQRIDPSQIDGTVDTLILKPSLLGGVHGAMAWVALASDSGKNIYWSSSYESGISLLNYGRLSAFLKLADQPMGYGTYPLLAQDTLARALPWGRSQGTLSADQSWNLNKELVWQTMVL